MLKTKIFVFVLGLFLCLSGHISAQQRSIQGTVVDRQGSPLPGVTVVIKGTSQGTITNADGNYSLNGINNETRLVFSFVGMTSQEVAVGNQISIDVTLIDATIGLDEVVAIGYGTQSRRTVISAIASVNSDDLEGIAVSSSVLALQGKLSGVRIYHSVGGQPGGDGTIRIRTGSSISKSNNPLILVDGMPRDLGDINPLDIESVDVLKDAAATAIYGARASNGVILVTTKRGKLGASDINFQMNTGIATPWRKLDLLGAEDFIRLQRESLVRSRHINRMNQATAFGTANGPQSPWSTRFLGDGETVPDGYLSMTDPANPNRTLIFQDNDMQDITFNQALEKDYYLSATGGTETIRYSAGIGYTDNEGIAIGSGYNRLSGRLNTEFVLGEKLTLLARMDYSKSNIKDHPNQNDMFNRSVWIAPTARIYMDDGSYGVGFNATFTNPLWYNDVNWRDQNKDRTNLGASLKWDITSDLEALIKGDYFQYNGTFESFYRSNPFNRSRPAIFDYNKTNKYQIEGLLTYNKSISDVHHFNAIVGLSHLGLEEFNARAEARGASSDKIMTLNAAPDKTDASTYWAEEVLNGFFGRLTYNYKQKYLASASIRRDGSSRFAEKFNIGYFPGATVGWIMSNEDFLKGNQFINTLKLRGSIGQTGNNSVGYYDYAGLFSVGANYGGSAGLFPTVMPNFGLKWETTTQWDVGFDLSLFENNRISILLDYYNKITNNLLFNVPLPAETGFNEVDQNVGKVRFWGYEFEISVGVFDTQKFQWRTDFNFGYAMNEVLKLPDNGMDKNRIGGVYDPSTGLGVGGIAEGERMYSMTGWLTNGILDTWEQANNALYDVYAFGWNPLTRRAVTGSKLPGDYEWIDKNGDERIDFYDQFVLGYHVPTITGGFTNFLRWKNIELNVFMDYAMGHKIDDRIRSIGNATNNQGVYNMTTDMLHAWREEGDYASGKAKFARFDHHDNTDQRNIQRVSDVFIYKGDFLCIRNLSLSYNATQISTRLGLRSLKLSIAGQNLHYFTHQKTTNPEHVTDDGSTQGNNAYPIPRKIVFGINVGL
jgi:TonB-linked SusC/RagA family outer membrane protein